MINVWLGAGTPVEAPWPCDCPQHGRRFCGSRGWMPGYPAPGPWGIGCKCWGRLDWWRFPGCCGQYWRPAPPTITAPSGTPVGYLENEEDD